MDLIIEIVSFFFKYLPLIAGAYLTISLLKVPDLTIESNWSVSAIVACMFVNVVPAYIAPDKVKKSELLRSFLHLSKPQRCFASGQNREAGSRNFRVATRKYL